MTPAQIWFTASTGATDLQREATARLLGTTNPYALAPFAMMRTSKGLRLAVAMEPPPCLDVDAVLSWQPNGDVVLVDPDTGNTSLLGDSGGWIVGDIPFGDTVTLYTCGLIWARSWASKRLAWLDLHKQAAIPSLAISEPLDYALPGLLLAGQFKAVRSWLPLLDRASVAVDQPAMIRPLAAALLRAKRVPHVKALAPQAWKVAA
ncbi:MAG: hypothetical protein CFE37_00105 [Alphaproteobacteria bacterium PA4]|nr:MAG: hypothetical protein CFE37_00105 [Alphaproteobacteria bacterium PA4]